jgi:DNA (cytosine-5)-methyltransferase 1
MAPSSIRIGTDCSGMEAPIQALKNLNLKIDHKFSCDINKHARATIKANFPHGMMYEDLTKRDNKKAPNVDIYIAGFPCQPFSTAGLQQGFNDEKGRGKIFFYVKDFIKKQSPRVFILENVSGLVTLEGGTYLDAIIEELTGLGQYNVKWQVMDTKEHGVPHSRRRWYCVGIRRDVDNGTFTFPAKMTCPSIDLFLEKRNSRLATTGLPPRTQTTALKNVKNALKQIRREGEDPLNKTYIVDCDSSVERSKYCKKQMSPCITVGRGGGHWVTSRGRRTTKEEMMRLQGMNPTKFKLAVSEAQLGRQLGNTMSVNVLERIFARLLPAAGLARKNSLPDRWATGEAVKKLSQTRGKTFTIHQEAASRAVSPSPSRVGKRRAASTTPERPTKRRATQK